MVSFSFPVSHFCDALPSRYSFPSSFSSNNNQCSAGAGAGVSVPTLPLSTVPSASARQSHSGFSELLSPGASRKARVLYDYDAASSNELSLLADEVSAHHFV